MKIVRILIIYSRKYHIYSFFRELGHTKSQRRTTFHEGLLLVLTEALKSESPAILKIALKTYSHYFSENCNIEEWVQTAKDKLYSSRLNCQDQLSNSYLSVLHCGDYGASRILELCESEDLKVRDTATFLLCKLSGKDFFRCKFRAGGVSILMTKIDIYPKNSRSKICYSVHIGALCIFKSIGH